MLLLHGARQQPDGGRPPPPPPRPKKKKKIGKNPTPPKTAPPPQAAKAGDACFAPAQPGRAAPRTRTLQGPYEGPQRSARPKTITL